MKKDRTVEGSQFDQNAGTRERLLEAAGEVFAEKGFRKATVREIVKKANANLNAVNYYFGDKESLFQAVLEQCFQHKLEDTLPENLENLDPEKLLRETIYSILSRMFKMSSSSWQTRIMMKEMVNPTAALDLVVAQFIKPKFDHLLSVIRIVAGDKVPDLKIKLCGESIIAQCVHIHHGKEIVQRIIPELTVDTENIDLIVDHITEFSMAAVLKIRQQYEKSS